MDSLYSGARMLVVFLFSLAMSAQTVGIGEVKSVETKASAIEANREALHRHKSELGGLENLSAEKLKKQKEELDVLYMERDALIADMKVGAKCSECGRYKSQFEKEGINFEQHLGDVKGYAVPATTVELEATRKKFTERIALKKVQIQQLEKGDAPVRKKREEIAALEEKNQRLCEEITAHSKNYEVKVLGEAKMKHDSWITELMDHATDILIAEDRIAIYNARQARTAEALRQEMAAADRRIVKEGAEAEHEKNEKIDQNRRAAAKLDSDQKEHLSTWESALAQQQKQKKEVERGLESAATEATRSALLAQLRLISEEIAGLQKRISDYRTLAQNQMAALDREYSQLHDELFQLRSRLPEKRTEATDKVKAVYEKLRIETETLLTKATADRESAKKRYAEKVAFFEKQQQHFLDMVIAESNRMIAASQSVSCPVWNEARFTITGNWSGAFACVNGIATMAKPYSTNVFDAYCSGQSAVSYMARYKSFLANLNQEDANVVKENSNAAWFERIMN